MSMQGESPNANFCRIAGVRSTEQSGAYHEEDRRRNEQSETHHEEDRCSNAHAHLQEVI